jgi:hypothetical protein
MERLIQLGLLCTLHSLESQPNMKWVVEALFGNMSGTLSALPSFRSHPLYISLSSATNTSTSNTTTTDSSSYATATKETIYATAECGNSNSNINSSGSNISRATTFHLVETPREISYKEIISATNNFSDSNRAVIHINITSSAVILDSDMNPRLGSFALAEFLTRNEHGHHVVTNTCKLVRGIFGYMSPEYMGSGEATPMADIYSFGVVVLEVVTGEMAIDFRWQQALLVNRVHQFLAWRRPLEELSDTRLNGEYNHKELMRLLKLGITCTGSNPLLRPTMRQIARILDGNDECFVDEGRTESKEEDERRDGEGGKEA